MLTDDPNHPGLKKYVGEPEEPGPQHDVYLVLPRAELDKGFTRPFRDSYLHKTCGIITKMGYDLSATYARNPKFYGATYCTGCRAHFPVSEFTWAKDGEVVGS